MNSKLINSQKYIQNMFENPPVMRYDNKEDFSAWQKKSREMLAEILGINSMKKCEDNFETDEKIEHDSYTELRFKFQSEEGCYVPCNLLLPKTSTKKHDAVICLQGHSSGMHISYASPIFESDEKTIAGGDRDFAIRAMKEGYAAFCVEQRYMGSCGCDEKGEPSCLNGTSLAAILMGRCAVGERVWDIMRLIDVIEKHFENINKDTLMCLGNSGGGTTAFYAACVDERIKCCVPSCSVCTYKDSIAAVHHCACNYIPNIANYFDMGDIGGLIAPRVLVAVHGKEDIIFPDKGVKEAFRQIKLCYDKAGAKDNCTLVTGNGGHRFYADDTWPVIHSYEKTFKNI